jgi:hypothetical protein
MGTTAVSGQAYKLEYSSYGGPEMSAGVHQREWSLKLDSADGSALLEKRRSDADMPGEPVGIFRAQLPPEKFWALFQLAQRVRLPELTPRGGGGLGSSVLTLTLEQGSTRVEKAFSSGDIAALDQLDPLIEELNRILGAMNNSPVAAIRAMVAYAPRERRFDFTVANIGTEAVCIGDPRFIAPGDPMQFAAVRVAEFPEERPGYTAPPLQWVQIPLAKPVQASGVPIVIRAGEKFTAPTAVWTAARPGVRYIAQAVLSDYSGPRETPGCYRIRGAAFSESVEFTLK